MTQENQNLIKQAYAAFNARDIGAILSLMHPDVDWPNGWEGGYVKGHREVRAYWTRQWKEINPVVTPLSFKERPGGELEVEVHQLVKGQQGNVLFDGVVKHVYTFDGGRIRSMEIQEAK